MKFKNLKNSFQLTTFWNESDFLFYLTLGSTVHKKVCELFRFHLGQILPNEMIDRLVKIKSQVDLSCQNKYEFRTLKIE